MDELGVVMSKKVIAFVSKEAIQKFHAAQNYARLIQLSVKKMEKDTHNLYLWGACDQNRQALSKTQLQLIRQYINNPTQWSWTQISSQAISIDDTLLSAWQAIDSHANENAAQDSAIYPTSQQILTIMNTIKEEYYIASVKAVGNFQKAADELQIKHPFIHRMS
jgi:hypothetical protein